MRTLEQRLKFDHGLTIGRHLVNMTHEGNTRKALIEISARGLVHMLLQPRDEDMYCSWARLKGDEYSTKGLRLYVWAARNHPELMAQFDGEPVATIPVKV